MRSALIHSLIFPVLLLASAAWGDEPRETSWVLLEGNHTHMSGSSADASAARALQRGDEPLLYVRRGERAWVIRDPATLARVRAAWDGPRKLGERMEPPSKKVEAIGARQSTVGAKMAPIGERMGELGQELATMPDEPRRTEIQAEMDRLQARIKLLSRQIEALSSEMRPYTAELQRLADEMKPLVKRSEAETEAIIDEAISRRLATPAE